MLRIIGKSCQCCYQCCSARIFSAPHLVDILDPNALQHAVVHQLRKAPAARVAAVTYHISTRRRVRIHPP